MISMIWAQDRRGLIGIDGNLPWHRPEDMKNFARLTRGNTVVMGRNTFKSLHNKPLLDRVNIILTKEETLSWNSNFKGWSKQRVFCRNNIEETFELLEDLEPKETFIIGGMQVYKTFAPYADRLYITVIDDIFPLNGSEATFFPWPVFADSYWLCQEQRKLGPDFYYVYDRVNNNANTKKEN